MTSETPFRTSIDVVRKWHALAERRRKHYVELYRSDRWRRYFTEDVFLLRMRDVIPVSRSGRKFSTRWSGRAASKTTKPRPPDVLVLA